MKWISLKDADWVNLTTRVPLHDPYDEEESIRIAIRLTEQRLKDLNTEEDSRS